MEERKQFRRKRKKACIFCVDKIVADYKDIDFMRKFLTDRGKIAPKRMTGCCTKHQRAIALEIKRGRQLGFLPYSVD